MGICTWSAKKNQSRNIFSCSLNPSPNVLWFSLLTQILCVITFTKQRLNQNVTLKTSNPHLSWSAESTWWPRKNKSTREECRCRQQLDTDVNGVRQSLQNATLHLCLCTWPKKRLLPTNAVLNTSGVLFF